MAPHKSKVESRGLVLRNRVISKGIIYVGPKKSSIRITEERTPVTEKKPGPTPRSKPRGIAKVHKCNLTKKRMNKIANFLKKIHLKPGDQIGTSWSTKWINALIKYMREPKRTAPTVEDVKRWLNSSNFFEETIQKILSELPSELPPVEVATDSSEFLSEMSAIGLSDSGMEHEASSVHAGSECEYQFVEPVSGKTGRNAISKNLDAGESSTSCEESEDDSETSLSDTDDERRISSVDRSKVKKSDLDRKENRENQAPGKENSTSSHNSYKAGDVISIFPEGFKWKGTVPLAEKRKQQGPGPIKETIPPKKPHLQATSGNGLQVDVKQAHSSSAAKVEEKPSQSMTADTSSSETPGSVHVGSFVASIPLTTGVVTEYFPEGAFLQTSVPDQNGTGGEEGASNGNQTFAVYGQVTNNSDSSAASCFTASTAEDVLAAMIKNGTLVLHSDNGNLDEGSLSSSAVNDHSLVQLHTNKIIEIATRNASQEGLGNSWNTVIYCATLLNMIMQGKF